MGRKRIEVGSKRFEIGERVGIAPNSPLAQGIALMIAAARQNAMRTIKDNGESTPN